VTAEGTQMTVIDMEYRSAPELTYDGRRLAQRPRRAARVRPGHGPVAYRGTGVRVSRAPHRPRPVGMTMTLILAAVAALITIWLVSLAQARGGSSAEVPEQLAVVQVQPGESLQRLAARVAPGAPVASVVDRIRELNQLDSAALDAGQTLIAPVS
jgi:LysM domain